MQPTTLESAGQLKARGAFYTPETVTRFLSRWAVRDPADRVLEPSCGDGAFVAAVRDRFAELGVTDLASRLLGIEREPAEAEKARAIGPSADIRVASFFELTPADVGRVTTVVGNPPYIRYHGWVGADRERSLERAQELGVLLTGLASSWASFVVWATAFLEPDDGRLALVLPAELLHTDYAEPVRQFLLQRFRSILVLAFDRLVFPDAQVDAVLLLASNDDDRGLRVVRLLDDRDLAAIADVGGLGVPTRGANRDVSSGRWNASLDEPASAVYASLIASGTVVRLGSIAQVDIGVVTGANGYFVLSADEARRHRLPRRVLRLLVERPSDLHGILVRAAECRHLFYPSEGDEEDPAVRAYLQLGEALGVPARYKPRMRRTWYRVPLPKLQADGLLPYMSHWTPRLVVGRRQASLSTNLLHGVSFRAPNLNRRAVAAAMLSAATALSAEVEGRSYGGGVLKLETQEAERLAVPLLSDAQESLLGAAFDGLDRLVRLGHGDRASAQVDEVLGMPHAELVEAAAAFRGRRLGRKSRAAQQAGPAHRVPRTLAEH